MLAVVVFWGGGRLLCILICGVFYSLSLSMVNFTHAHDHGVGNFSKFSSYTQDLGVVAQ